MAESCTLVPAPRALRYSTALLLALFLLALSVDLAASTHGVTGTAPSFTQEPQDVVVFERDAAGNRVSLTLNCMASGNPPPNITWYRGSTTRLPNSLVNANGTLHIVNITENTDATRAGLLYYCIANNTFGMIRSKAANVSYAYFDGFNGPSAVTVNVTTEDDEDTVALECYVGDANPPPQIRWLRNGMPLTEVMTNNRIRFLNNGHYLLLRELTTANVTGVNYQCQVTNARLHGTETSSTMYTLVDNIGTNDFRIYKRLLNRTILSGDTVEMSYIAGAGAGLQPFTIERCRRTSSTGTSFILRDDPGGVIEETVPRPGETLPSVADSVTFNVRCTLFNVTQPILSEATLSVQAGPQITIPSQQGNAMDLERLVGESRTFTCTIAGVPTPTVTWYRDNVQLNPGVRISINRVSPSTATLAISGLTEGDTGMYQCIASNVVGRAQASWALQVRTPTLSAVSMSSSQFLSVDPIIGERLLVAPSDGGQVVLFAVVNSDPCPTIQWRFNGTAISNGGNYVIESPCTSAGSVNFTLTITANAATTGLYNATITNPPMTRNVPDVFVTPPVPVVISELRITSSANCLLSGTSVNIQCVNSGFPRPEIVFFQGTEQIIPGEGSRFTQVSFDTVSLSNARQADDGQYVCEARMGTRELNRSRPEGLVFCTQPEIVSLPAPMTLTEGDRFELICTFTGIPTPEIRWEKDGSVFPLGEGRRVINSTASTTKTSQLEISRLLRSDDGVYTCSVTNVANRVTRNGMDSRSVRLEVRPLPPPPVLDTPAIIGIAAGGAGGVLLLTVVCLLMVCVYCCARRGREGVVTFESGKDGGQNFTDARGNVDRDSDEEFGQAEAYAPDYESLPTLRPAMPPQYRPTPTYPHGVHMSEDIEMTKVPPPDTDSTHFNEFIATPYGKQAPPFPRAGQW